MLAAESGGSPEIIRAEDRGLGIQDRADDQNHHLTLLSHRQEDKGGNQVEGKAHRQVYRQNGQNGGGE